MTAAEKILAVQTLFNEMTKTVYNGSVAVNSSAAMGRTRFSVASVLTNPTQSFSVAVSFIYNGLATDAQRPDDDPLFEMWGASGSHYNFGYNFASGQFFAAQSGGGFISDPVSIIQSATKQIQQGEVNTVVFKVEITGNDSTTITISLNGSQVLIAGGWNFLSEGVYLIFKGVDMTVLSTKAYYQTGVLIESLKGAHSFDAPFWVDKSDAFQPSEDVITITSPNAASEALIVLYLNMAADKILRRLYPLDPTKTILDLPASYDMTQVELAARLFARAGAEGEISHSENGISRSYATVDDEDILSRVVPYTKVW